jgi:hypothetical protein
LCALSAVAHYLLRAPEAVETAVRASATLGGLDEERLLEVAQDAHAVLRAA